MNAVEYVQAGLALISMAKGTKGPKRKGWNNRERCITTEAAARKLVDCNIGLAHAYCTPTPTCAIDVDDMVKAVPWFRERGIDLLDLILADDAVLIVSGRKGRSKLLYRLPHALETKSIVGEHGIELRCASKTGRTVQDVLPPSIHPYTGTPYRWEGDWRAIPAIPPALMAVWESELKALPTALPAENVSASAKGPLPDLETVRAALAYIDADESYKRWIAYGQALKHDHGESGREVWVTWSNENGSKWKDEDGERWNGFDRNKGDDLVTCRTIVYDAKQLGYKLPAREFGVIPHQGARGIDPTVELNDDNVALRFAREYGGKRLYDHARERWFVWDSTRWKLDDTRLVFNDVRGLCRRLNTRQEPQFAKVSFMSAVEVAAQRDPTFATTTSRFDPDQWLLGTPGGTVDLRTGELRPADPADLITKQTAAAPDEDRPPERWLKFLDQACGSDATLIGFLQRYFGYALTGSTREECLAFATGPGGNGKGVLTKTLSEVWGDYAKTATMATFVSSALEKHTTDIAMLAGARLVVASETKEGQAWDVARIKDMTGGDPVTARFMRQDNFTYQPQFKLFLVGNHKPGLPSVGDAERRRFHIVPFVHKPDKADIELKDALKAEWGGILQWAIEGCLAWQRGGLSVPKVVLDETKDYLSMQDVVGQWLADCMRVGPTLCERSTPMWESWEDYCIRQGVPKVIGSRVTFADKLKARGFASKKFGRGERGFSGLALKPKGADDFDDLFE